MKILHILLMLSLVACSSTKKEAELEERENEDIARDYTVIDASGKTRPGWIEDPVLWSKEYGKDTEKYRFFSYETEPKVGRKVACDLAKSNVRADIASEISTFIDKQLGTSIEGVSSVDENNPDVQGLKEYTESTLVEKTKTLIHGASVIKTYWEKRRYLQKLGAKKDYMAYTCAVYIRMSSDTLAKAVDNAAKAVIERASKTTVKDNVKNALENASKDFLKASAGEI
ncbi:MAG: hypothetical protein ACN6I6_00085 [bacterium]